MERALRGGRVNDIRRLAVSDLAAYRALHRRALKEAAQAFVETPEEDADKPDSDVAPVLERGEAWGAFVDGKLVGKMTIDCLPYAALAHTRWLHALYVGPEGRGGGLAVKLVEAAMQDAQAVGASRFILWVNTENKAARRFYEKLGFRETGRIPGGIRMNGRIMDDVLMCREATP